MRTKLAFDLSKRFSSFKSYLKHNSSYINYIVTNCFHRAIHTDDELEELAAAVNLQKLDDEFKALLSKEEQEIAKYLAYHNPYEKAPENIEKYMNSAYEKWLNVFFKEKSYLYEEIDPKKLGKIMFYIRTRNEMKKTTLAEHIGVDRSTVSKIENGERLPSLDYVYKFSKIFIIKIDDLIELSTEKSIF